MRGRERDCVCVRERERETERDRERERPRDRENYCFFQLFAGFALLAGNPKNRIDLHKFGFFGFTCK